VLHGMKGEHPFPNINSRLGGGFAFLPQQPKTKRGVYLHIAEGLACEVELPPKAQRPEARGKVPVSDLCNKFQSYRNRSRSVG